jgi:uncharacterized protein
MPKFGWAEKTPEAYMGWYLFMWRVTLLMFFDTLRANKVTNSCSAR